MRRSRESTARGHGSPPLLVKDVSPFSDHQYPTAKRHAKPVIPAKKKAKRETQARIDG